MTGYLSWDRVTDLVRAGRIGKAKRMLGRLRDNTTDPGLRAEIDSLAERLELVEATKRLLTKPPRYIWLMNIALCLDLVAGVVFIMVGIWQAPAWATAVVTGLLAPVPIVVIRTGSYRYWMRPIVCVVAILAAILAILLVGRYGLAPVLWSLGAFVVILLFAIMAEKSYTSA